MLDLYKNIKQLRLNRGMTQTELASKTGYSDKGMISRIEKGSIDLPVSKIEAFASALCTDPLHLMGDSWSQLPQPLRTESEDLLLSDFRQLIVGQLSRQNLKLF